MNREVEQRGLLFSRRGVSSPHWGLESAVPEIQKVSYTHDGIIDAIIANPAISGGELAALFGYSQCWMSIMVNSDAFKNRLAERKAEIVDPRIVASVEERLEAVAKKSLEKILDRLDAVTPLKTSEIVSIAKLAIGDRNTRPAGPAFSQNLYVMNIPPPAADSAKWLASTSSPRGPAPMLENTGGVYSPGEILQNGAQNVG
jgi:hypothetical protein